MTQDLQGLLAPNLAISRFLIRPIERWSSQTITVALGDMTQIPCDAYVAPHYQTGVAYGGATGAISMAGALSGWRTYYDYVRELGVEEQPYGSAHVAESGGGNSRRIINVVSKRVGGEDSLRSFFGVIAATKSAMEIANRENMHRVVFPDLAAEVGYPNFAREVLETIYLEAHASEWKRSRSPQEVIVVVSDRRAYQHYWRVLLSGIIGWQARHVRTDAETGTFEAMLPGALHPVCPSLEGGALSAMGQ